MRQVASVTKAVTRGDVSWTYIYVMMGFALTIEGTVISMITPLRFPCNIATYLAIAVATVYLFTSSARFQNRLLAFKAWYENKARKI